MNDQQLNDVTMIKLNITKDMFDRLSDLPEDKEKIACILHGLIEAYSDCTAHLIAICLSLVDEDEEKERDILRDGLSNIGKKALAYKKLIGER